MPWTRFAMKCLNTLRNAHKVLVIGLFLRGVRVRKCKNKRKIQVTTIKSVRVRLRECPATGTYKYRFYWDFKWGFGKVSVSGVVRLRECPTESQLYPICELLYFLTYYFLIKSFVVFAELMWINQLLYIQNYWLCSHVAITLNNPDFKINYLLYLLC